MDQLLHDIAREDCFVSRLRQDRVGGEWSAAVESAYGRIGLACADTPLEALQVAFQRCVAAPPPALAG